MLDDVDLLIIKALSRKGRLSWADLAATVGISRQTAAERVQKLEQAGVITGYTALVSPEAVGADLTAFVGVVVERPEQCAPFLQAVALLDEVQECHHVAGDDSYLLKVRTRGTRGLERLISDMLKQIPGVVKTRSTIVLSTAKERATPPLQPSGGAR